MAKKLGEMLIEAGLIDEHQLEIALAEQARVGSKVGTILADLGFTTEEAISRVLADQAGTEYCELAGLSPEPEAVKSLEASVARRHEVLPLRLEGEALIVAMSDPTDIVAIDEVQRTSRRFVQVVSAARRELLRGIDRAYGPVDGDASRLERVVEKALEEVRGTAGGEASAVVDLVHDLLSSAVARGVTDVHFQPDKRVVRVRYRIDGDLVQGPTFRRELHGSLVARLKVMAELDISESRLPQDGKIRFFEKERSVDLRVSTFPSVFGESVVIRILDKQSQDFSLDALGLEERGTRILRRAARRPHGLVLAAGPTGSGKSTTLYSLLHEVDASRRKVVTLEDPVEYEMPLVTQCQVNERAGLVFTQGLRAILRHDPDVILVGEMRDAETASMALRAALTGHLVFSTVHTNDAVRTVSRLIDMGLERYLVASCLSVVAAQRLVRRICPDCREEDRPDAADLEAAGLASGEDGSFARGRGCAHCHGTGLRGREALFEVLEVDSSLARLIARGAPTAELEEAAAHTGFAAFAALAAQRAREGRISLREAARVVAGV